MSNSAKAYLLIIIGIILLVVNLDIVSMDPGDLWPLVILGLGIIFINNWRNDKEKSGLIFTGILLSTIGTLFLFLTITGWDLMEYLWPVFILAPGMGFIAMYWASGYKDKGVLFPGYILIGLAAIFLFLQSPLDDYWPLILIAVGIVILFQAKKSFNGEEKETLSDNSNR